MKTLGIALLFLAISVNNILSQDIEKENQISVSATLTPSSFSSMNISAPSWLIKLKIKNNSGYDIDLGESFIVVEKNKETPKWLACYIGREKSDDSKHLYEFRNRYNISWGYSISKTGSYAFAIGGSFTVSKIINYDSLGYGQLLPGMEKEIKEEVVFPYKFENGVNEYVTVICPSINLIENNTRTVFFKLFKFVPDDDKNNLEFNPIESLVVPIEKNKLIDIVNDEKKPGWLRLFALNWLSENFPSEASETLISLLNNANVEEGVKLVAIINLGLIKSKKGIKPLQQIFQSTDQSIIRSITIEALKKIEDSSITTFTRKYILDADEKVAKTAVEIAGMFRDTLAINSLKSIISSTDLKIKELKEPALKSIELIGGCKMLLDIFQSTDQQNIKHLSILSLKEIGDPIIASFTRKYILDADEVLASSAIEIAGKLNDTVALNTLVSVLSSKKTKSHKLKELTVESIASLGGCKTLWNIYTGVNDDIIAQSIRKYLINLNFTDSEKQATTFLMQRLDRRKNKLWYQDIKLLRHLTGQNIGPTSEFEKSSTIKADIEKWHQWWSLNQ